MNLFIVRHGQTEANVYQLFNGRNEKDLNQTGIDQAKSLVPTINKLSIDLIISSPLKRTLHTAQILNTKNSDIITDDRIIERDYKDMTLKPASLIKDESILYNLNSYEEVEGIESFKAIYDRVENFINEIKNKYPNKNILIVTHGDIVVAFQTYLDKKMPENYPDNCELIKYKL